MRYRFVHAADLHLDTPFSGIARADGAVAQALRDASLDAWDALVDLALDEGAAFLALAGDVYDGPRRGLRAQLRFLAGVRRLCAAGVQVFAVHGNHDPLGAGWSAVAEWPAGMTFFPADRPAAVPVQRDGLRLATVQGVSFARAEEGRNLAALFAPEPGGGVQVGLLHANVGADPEHGDYAPCTVEDLRAGGMDYWALGHVHQRRTVLAGDPCWAMYPGVLQGRSPAPGERGAKGALVVECDSEHGVLGEPRFVPLDRVRFVTLAVDVAGQTDPAGAVEHVSRRLQDLRADAEHTGRGLVVRITLTGGTAELARLAAAGELAAEVRTAADDLDPFLWCESLQVLPSDGLSREAAMRRGDFAADLAARSGELEREPDRLAELMRELDDDLPAAVRTALRGELREGVAARDLLPAAEAECLRLLAGAAEEPD